MAEQAAEEAAEDVLGRGGRSGGYGCRRRRSGIGVGVGEWIVRRRSRGCWGGGRSGRG